MIHQIKYVWLAMVFLLAACAAQQPQPETLEERAYVVAETMVGVAEAANQMRDEGIISAEVHNDLLDDLARANDKLREARKLAEMGQSDVASERIEFAQEILKYVKAELEARNGSS